MTITVIFASHRMGGKSKEIKKAMLRYQSDFNFDFIHLAKEKVEGCTDCRFCAQKGYCVLRDSDNDCFQTIFEKMQKADAIFIISPVYAGIPSRLTALFERLISFLFYTERINTDQYPLLNKKVAVFSYCSAGVCDEAPIKLICDKFFMKDYCFDRTTYTYLNSLADPRARYDNITNYVTDTLELLK